jgi:hypothetical protein
MNGHEDFNSSVENRVKSIVRIKNWKTGSLHFASCVPLWPPALMREVFDTENFYTNERAGLFRLLSLESMSYPCVRLQPLLYNGLNFPRGWRELWLSRPRLFLNSVR